MGCILYIIDCIKGFKIFFIYCYVHMKKKLSSAIYGHYYTLYVCPVDLSDYLTGCTYIDIGHWFRLYMTSPDTCSARFYWFCVHDWFFVLIITIDVYDVTHIKIQSYEITTMTFIMVYTVPK